MSINRPRIYSSAINRHLTPILFAEPPSHAGSDFDFEYDGGKIFPIQPYL